MSDDASDEEPRDRPPRTPAEWWMFGLSAGLIALVLGVVVMSWTTGATGPPVFVVSPSGPIELEGGSYRVPYEVTNDGGDAADQVQVVATLEVGGEVVGEAEQTVAFLSGGETESGVFLFATDPTDGELTLEVASYASP